MRQPPPTLTLIDSEKSAIQPWRRIAHISIAVHILVQVVSHLSSMNNDENAGPVDPVADQFQVKSISPRRCKIRPLIRIKIQRRSGNSLLVIIGLVDIIQIEHLVCSQCTIHIPTVPVHRPCMQIRIGIVSLLCSYETNHHYIVSPVGQRIDVVVGL